MSNKWIAKIFLLIFLIINPSFAVSKTLVIESGSFTIVPIHGNPIEVISMELANDDKDLLFYTTKDGTEGFIHRTNIKNVNELLGFVQGSTRPRHLAQLMEKGREQDSLAQEAKTRKENQQKNPAKTRSKTITNQYHTQKEAESTIKADCHKKWETDYEMIEYCIKNRL